MTIVHGMNISIQLWLPPTTGFHLDVDTLDGGVGLGGAAGWQDTTCHISEMVIERGDMAVDQRPNSALELGTMTLVAVNQPGAAPIIPDDLALLLGLTPMGIHAGNKVRVMNLAWNKPIFTGQVISYDAEWTTGAQVIEINAVDAVADIAAVNPIALDQPQGYNESEYQRWSRLAAMSPVPVKWNGTNAWRVRFRGDTYGEPLSFQWQKWGDTALAHLGMDATGTLRGRYIEGSPSNTWTTKDCQLPQGGSSFPTHWGHLRVDAAAVVNDCLCSTDDPWDFRWLMGSPLTDPGDNTWFGHIWHITQNPDGQTGYITFDALDVNRKDRWAYFQGAAPLADVEVRASESSYRWKIDPARPPVLNVDPTRGRYILLHCVEMTSIPIMDGRVVTVALVDKETPPSESKAQHVEDPTSKGYYGLQDYRRLDLPLQREGHALTWAGMVVEACAYRVTYMDQVECHLHRQQPSTTGALRVELLDRLKVQKKFTEYGGQVIEFTCDVVGIVDEVNEAGWIRRFHLTPVEARRLARADEEETP